MVFEQAGDFLGYIRLELCIFSGFIAASGYLLNNLLSGDIFFVVLASFFVCAGAYSYNNITDKKEDIINRKRANHFSSSASGKFVTAAAFMIGLVFSLFLSFSSVLFYLLAVITSVAYSAFRLKKYLFVKNLYTAFGVTQVFLIGAATSPITSEAILYYIMLSAFILIESIISDLRDYEGDKASDVRTIPVVLGYEFTRRLIFSLLGLYSFFILTAANRLLILLPFIFLMSFLLQKNRISAAHSSGSISFIFLALWLL